MLRMHAQKRNRTFHEPWGAGSVHLAQPFQGCEDPSLPTQGSLGPSRTGQHSATLGFEAESLWDSRFEVHGHNAYAKRKEALHDRSFTKTPATNLCFTCGCFGVPEDGHSRVHKMGIRSSPHRGLGCL